MRSRRPLLLTITLVGGVSLALPVGCGADDPSLYTNGEGASSGSGTSSGEGSSGTFGEQDGGARVVYAELRIDPPDAVIDVDLGQPAPTKAYKVFGKLTATSPEQEVTAKLTFDRFDAAAFNGLTLTPTGFIGAKGEVTAVAGASTARTSATIRLRTVVGTVPPAATLAALDGATTADPSLKILYPYDKTVFPRGVGGPVLQWNGAINSDVYRIKANSASFSLTAYTTGTGTNGEYTFPTLPADVWTKLTDSTVGTVTVDVQRFSAGTAYKPVTSTWTIAGANLKGTVYYTRLVQGDSFVRRIEPGKAAEAFLQRQGETCIACHSVSNNGERIVAGINGGASPWGVWDARTGARLYQSTKASGFQAISPDGSHVLWRHWNGGGFGSDGYLLLSKFDNDAEVARFTPPMGTGQPSHPVWSPDGKTIALGMRTSGNGLDYRDSTLALVDVSLAGTPSFANFRRIVSPDATYRVVTNPTFTPDSKWVGFMRANKSRGSDNDSLGELWLSNLDGTTQIPLDLANGAGVLPAKNRNFGPSFHPIAAGGYFWVAFYASRPWGHKFTGANRQLWIAAVNANPSAGGDPSHPAFYIGGQETNSINERPQFAVPPCKKSGETCESGYECCDGKFCRADTSGKLTCQEPKGCAQIGDSCKQDSDCCSGLPCIGGTCQPRGPS